MNDTSQKLSFISQLHNFTRTKAADNQQNQPKTFQGHVSQILENDMLEFTLDATGPFTLPKLVIPQAFSKYTREPTQVGDKGYAVPSDFSISPTDGVSGGTANMYPRGNLATHVFHPISNKNFDQRDPNQFLVTGGPSGHKTQTQDKSTFHLLDALNNIIHNSSANIAHTALNNLLHTVTQGIMSHVSPQIQQIASQALTIANTGDMINLVAKHFTVGAPSSEFVLETFADNSTTPPTTPTPSAQTIFNVIGSITASGNISAGGMISAAGFGGAPGGGFPGAGASGEIIFSNITAGATITSDIPAGFTFIELTPGIWTVQGEVWFNPTAGLTAMSAAINTLAAIPNVSEIGIARHQIWLSSATPTNDLQILPLRPCYVNITANTTYFLVAQATFSGNCTVMGNIWAQRS
ncbi:MAG TPA: hypothetical protein VK890_13790 [Bacteroidia bacterium]|nr:hypothetical protein [Bacteroidia bacterium]